MRQIVHIEAQTPGEFVEKVNETYADLSRFQIVREQFNSPTDMYLIYEEPEAEPDQPRLCAECSLYKWNIGCSHTKGKVIRPKHPACEHFTQDPIGEEEVNHEEQAVIN